MTATAPAGEGVRGDVMKAEYTFDYSKARPNHFARAIRERGMTRRGVPITGREDVGRDKKAPNRPDDVRDRNDPGGFVPPSFWDAIDAARADPTVFARMSDDELVAFADEMHGLKTYFAHPPFHPPPEVCVTETSLDEAGAWVISQGREYFFAVWREPEAFHRVMSGHEFSKGRNFEFAADEVWNERHGTDIPTI